MRIDLERKVIKLDQSLLVLCSFPLWVLEKENILIKPLKVLTHSSLKPERNERWTFSTNEKPAFGAPGPRGAEMLGEDQVASRGTQGGLGLEQPAELKWG